MNKRKGVVSIDFWNTLVDGKVNGEARNEIRLKALHKLAATHRTEVYPQQIKEAYKIASDRFDKVWIGEQRTLKTIELVTIVLDTLNIPATSAEAASLAQVYAESLWDGPPALATGVKEAIKSISGKYDLGIISDTMYSPGSVLRVFLEKEGLLSYFSSFVFSDEVGYSKPDKRAFYSIKSQLNCEETETAFHIGDLQKTDVFGANASGFISIQYTELSPSEPTLDAKHTFASWQEIARFLDEY